MKPVVQLLEEERGEGGGGGGGGEGGVLNFTVHSAPTVVLDRGTYTFRVLTNLDSQNSMTFPCWFFP